MKSYTIFLTKSEDAAAMIEKGFRYNIRNTDPCKCWMIGSGILNTTSDIDYIPDVYKDKGYFFCLIYYY